ncbi:MAG: hypothetical protein IT429_17965 [Gemmataceae bacterium]|nr:hypothetical protein [Gemmataceae bacterium]
MDEVPILGSNDERRIVSQFIAYHGVPAYVRRAREVEEAFERLIERCERQREEWLPMVRLRLGTLHDLAGEWELLEPLLTDGDLDALRQLHAALAPRLRVPVARTSSPRALRRAVRDLRESLEHFNRRWQTHLEGLNFAAIDELRDGYNRYYVVEKECAVRSPALARQGFRPLAPVTLAEVAARLPTLPVPRLRE